MVDTIILRCASRHCMKVAVVPVQTMQNLLHLRGHLNVAQWGLQRVRITSSASFGQGEHHFAPLCPQCWGAVQAQWNGQINI